ncbi:hypothetical protein Rsub_12054 [Raphidocelis subcapitata]|uniref:MARVEL domain-containing protein n=1 Tax=Raphidocelis subcapitata TaxID=307507 RepID=A0A2V0PHJ9_9CHLO|nr:hypothetical protein Rsub_12054 [Raphidocelis subcapitata]|eukprot:GBF99294.1 hypothetical protein Rsub_12054 [Raphidocelis subcapitata]
MMQAQAAAVATLPPEAQRKLRRASWVNFGASMLQLACSVAVIIMVRYNLEGAGISIFSLGGRPATGVQYACLLATEEWPGACRYAYSVASISVLCCFLLSLMQCLTMDCCGMGRLLECLVDAGLAAWWLAAGITLSSRAAVANGVGLPKAGHRNAVVAMAWLSVVLFLVLLAVNAYLTLKLGRAYVSIARLRQQQQQQAGGIQMASPFGPAGGAGAAYPGGPYPGAPPPAWGAPHGVPAYGVPAGYAGAAPGAYPGASPYGPPLTQAVVGAPAGAYSVPYAMPTAAHGAGPSSGAAAASAAAGGGGADKPLAANPGNYLPQGGR